MGKAIIKSTDGTLHSLEGRQTKIASLVSEQNLSDSYTDFGSEINMEGYNYLGVYVKADVNNSETVTLRVLGKHTSGGDDEFVINDISDTNLWTTGASDFKKYYKFDIGTVPFIQLQAKATTVGATPGDLTISVDKKWRN